MNDYRAVEVARLTQSDLSMLMLLVLISWLISYETPRTYLILSQSPPLFLLRRIFIFLSDFVSVPSRSNVQVIVVVVVVVA